LEMLETKTKGNLTGQEATLLKQSLTSARMAFVEAVDRGEQPGGPAPGTPAPAPDAAAPGGETQPETAPGGEAEADSRKKFTKRY
jgi:uncharacterized protein DUF1844